MHRHSQMAAIVVMLAVNALGEAATAQQPTSTATKPCDPLIDGTYCATQGGRAFSGGSSSVNMGSIQSLSSDLSLGRDSPATFAGISFSSSNGTCMGLLRRASCN